MEADVSFLRPDDDGFKGLPEPTMPLEYAHNEFMFCTAEQLGEHPAVRDFTLDEDGSGFVMFEWSDKEYVAHFESGVMTLEDEEPS